MKIVYASTIALTFAVALPRAAQHNKVEPPSVPDTIRVEAGFRPFLVAHAVGTQAYMCLPSGSTVKWTPVGPQATLFNDESEQILTHFLSPTPSLGGALNATWQHSRDTSAVWAFKIAESSDAAFVAPGAIAWLLLQVADTEEGPGGGDKLTPAVFIHRVNTVGGKEPSTGCSVPADVSINNRRFVPYTADYYFYSEVTDNDD